MTMLELWRRLTAWLSVQTVGVPDQGGDPMPPWPK